MEAIGGRKEKGTVEALKGGTESRVEHGVERVWRGGGWVAKVASNS